MGNVRSFVRPSPRELFQTAKAIVSRPYTKRPKTLCIPETKPFVERNSTPAQYFDPWRRNQALPTQEKAFAGNRWKFGCLHYAILVVAAYIKQKFVGYLPLPLAAAKISWDILSCSLQQQKNTLIMGKIRQIASQNLKLSISPWNRKPSNLIHFI